MIRANGKDLSVFAFVFARGGSKGVPGKNIRGLAGRPLLAYAIQCAQTTPGIDRVIVSTDSREIAAVAETYGASVPFIRPAELATDQSSEWLAWQHALDFLRQNGEMPDIFLSVPATSPLRDKTDLKACVDKLVNGAFDIVITATEAARNPYFNMIRITEDGLAELAFKPDQPIVRRQDAPVFYDVTTVAYAARSEFILRHQGLFQGRVGTIIVPVERAMDIDTEMDFKIADFLMRERQSEKTNAADG